MHYRRTTATAEAAPTLGAACRVADAYRIAIARLDARDDAIVAKLQMQASHGDLYAAALLKGIYL
jgi:hypothetical protein